MPADNGRKAKIMPLSYENPNNRIYLFLAARLCGYEIYN